MVRLKLVSEIFLSFISFECAEENQIDNHLLVKMVLREEKKLDGDEVFIVYYPQVCLLFSYGIRIHVC